MKRKLHGFGVSQFMSHIFSILQVQEIAQSELSELVSSGIDLFTNEDWEQGFAWFQNIILIPLQAQSGLIWTEIWLAEEEEIIALPLVNEVSLLLPWHIDKNHKIFIDNDDFDSKNILQDIKHGWYKILYEERKLHEDDFEYIEPDFYSGNLEEEHHLGIGPTFCKLTFFPTSSQIGPDVVKLSKKNTLSQHYFLHEISVFPES